MKLKAGISSIPCREVSERESSSSWLSDVCGMKLKKSGNICKKSLNLVSPLYAACLVAAVKLKAGISSSSCRVVSEREFLEFDVSCLWNEVEENRRHMQKSKQIAHPLAAPFCL